MIGNPAIVERPLVMIIDDNEIDCFIAGRVKKGGFF
jgi:hypothetical protein